MAVDPEHRQDSKTKGVLNYRSYRARPPEESPELVEIMKKQGVGQTRGPYSTSGPVVEFLHGFDDELRDSESEGTRAGVGMLLLALGKRSRAGQAGGILSTQEYQIEEDTVSNSSDRARKRRADRALFSDGGRGGEEDRMSYAGDSIIDIMTSDLDEAMRLYLPIRQKHKRLNPGDCDEHEMGDDCLRRARAYGKVLGRASGLAILTNPYRYREDPAVLTQRMIKQSHQRLKEEQA